jgi:hypothetical protein
MDTMTFELMAPKLKSFDDLLLIDDWTPKGLSFGLSAFFWGGLRFPK